MYQHILIFLLLALSVSAQGSLGASDTGAGIQSIPHVDFNYTSLADSTCSSEFGRLGDESCLIMYANIYMFSPEIFINTLLEADKNNLVRRLYVKLHDNTDRTHLKIGSILDDFLVPRPWWILAKEHYYGHHNPLASHFFLLRQGPLYEPILRYRSALQFPPETICNITRLRVGHCDVRNGYGTLAIIFTLELNYHQDSVIDLYDSMYNEPDEWYPYASPEECPNLINKRLCAYLPITNCTLPNELKFQFNGSSFQQHFGGDWYLLFTNASAEGMKYSNSQDEMYRIPNNEYQLKMKQLYDDKPPHFAAGPFYNGYKLRPPMDEPGSYQYRPNPSEIVPALSLFFRNNAHYRMMIQNKIHEVKSKNSVSLHRKMQCTAIHIRRGDRVNHQVNMTEYCNDVIRTRVDNTDTCTSKSGEFRDCHSLLDWGCFHERSYGAITLQEYLNRAFEIHPTYNIFIATDDGNWLEEEKQKLSSEWNILSVSGSPSSRSISDSKSATKNGVDFFTSLAFARQCQAFVGHWGSAISHLFYHYMCISHDVKVNSCPPAINIGGQNSW